MRPHTENNLISTRRAELRNTRAAILYRLNTLKLPQVSDEALSAITTRGESALKKTSELAVSMLMNVLYPARTVACRELRFFRIAYAIRHTAASPSILNTMLVLVPLICIEGVAMGVTMTGNGDMNFVPAVAYGFVFSGVNVALAVSAGYFCTRYMTYHVNSRYADEQDIKIRKLAHVGFAVHLILLTLLVFSTLRIRALGQHQGIFDFSEIGFFATFNNGFTLVTLAICFLSTVIGIYEGRHGFSDVVPGYTAIQHRAEVLFDQQAEDLVEDSYQSIEEHAQNTMDELAERLELRERDARKYNDEINALHADIVAFNNSVISARDDAHTYALEESEIEASTVKVKPVDVFDGLLLDAQLVPPPHVDESAVRGDALIGLLSLTSDQANADVMAAHAAFLARKPGIEFPGPSARRAFSDTQSSDELTGGPHYA